MSMLDPNSINMSGYAIQELHIGQKASFSKTILGADIHNFAGIIGDFNPVHVNKVEAEKSRFGKQIAHGMLCSSLISTVLGTQLPGKGTIYLEQSLKFCSPVYIGDTITAEVSLEELLPKNRALFKTVAYNQDDTIVIDGNATVILP